LPRTRRTTAADVIAVTINDDDPPVIATHTPDYRPLDTATGDTVTATITNVDSDTAQLVYAWTQTAPDASVSQITITHTDTGQPTATLAYPDLATRTVQEFTLTLTVTDTNSLQATEDVVITVRDATPPTAVIAGDASRNVLTGQTGLTLSASASRRAGFMMGDGTDDDSGISYQWLEVASPTGTTQKGSPRLETMDTRLGINAPFISGVNTNTFTYYTRGTPATYYILLTVTDDVTGTTATARATIVAGLPVLPGPTLTVTDVGVPNGVPEGTLNERGALTAATITLAYTAAKPGAHDNDQTQLALLWEQVTTAAGDTVVTQNPITVNSDGMDPPVYSISAPDVASQTTYYFRLRGRLQRNQYITGETNMVATVVINDVEPPTARITTADATVAEGAVTDLAASGSDNDETATDLDYKWTVTKVPSDGPDPMFSDPSANPGDATDLVQPRVTWPAHSAAQRETVYTLTLTVTDAQGLQGTDSVVITVQDRDGDPTAAAPIDRNVSGGQSVALDAAGSTNAAGEADTDGRVRRRRLYQRGRRSRHRTDLRVDAGGRRGKHDRRRQPDFPADRRGRRAFEFHRPDRARRLPLPRCGHGHGDDAHRRRLGDRHRGQRHAGADRRGRL